MQIIQPVLGNNIHPLGVRSSLSNLHNIGLRKESNFLSYIGNQSPLVTSSRFLLSRKYKSSIQPLIAWDTHDINSEYPLFEFDYFDSISPPENSNINSSNPREESIPEIMPTRIEKNTSNDHLLEINIKSKTKSKSKKTSKSQESPKTKPKTRTKKAVKSSAVKNVKKFVDESNIPISFNENSLLVSDEPQQAEADSETPTLQRDIASENTTNNRDSVTNIKPHLAVSTSPIIESKSTLLRKNAKDEVQVNSELTNFGAFLSPASNKPQVFWRGLSYKVAPLLPRGDAKSDSAALASPRASGETPRPHFALNPRYKTVLPTSDFRLPTSLTSILTSVDSSGIERISPLQQENKLDESTSGLAETSFVEFPLPNNITVQQETDSSITSESPASVPVQLKPTSANIIEDTPSLFRNSDNNEELVTSESQSSMAVNVSDVSANVTLLQRYSKVENTTSESTESHAILALPEIIQQAIAPKLSTIPPEITQIPKVSVISPEIIQQAIAPKVSTIPPEITQIPKVSVISPEIIQQAIAPKVSATSPEIVETPIISTTLPEIIQQAIAPKVSTIPPEITQIPKVSVISPEIIQQAIAPKLSTIPPEITQIPKVSAISPEIIQQAIAPKLSTIPPEITQIPKVSAIPSEIIQQAIAPTINATLPEIVETPIISTTLPEIIQQAIAPKFSAIPPEITQIPKVSAIPSEIIQQAIAPKFSTIPPEIGQIPTISAVSSEIIQQAIAPKLSAIPPEIGQIPTISAVSSEIIQQAIAPTINATLPEIVETPTISTTSPEIIQEAIAPTISTTLPEIDEVTTTSATLPEIIQQAIAPTISTTLPEISETPVISVIPPEIIEQAIVPRINTTLPEISETPVISVIPPEIIEQAIVPRINTTLPEIIQEAIAPTISTTLPEIGEVPTTSATSPEIIETPVINTTLPEIIETPTTSATSSEIGETGSIFRKIIDNEQTVESELPFLITNPEISNFVDTSDNPSSPQNQVSTQPEVEPNTTIKNLPAPKGYATGGHVKDSHVENRQQIAPSDTVPAMLTPGEFVINTRDAQKNLPLLRHINTGGTLEDIILPSLQIPNPTEPEPKTSSETPTKVDSFPDTSLQLKNPETHSLQISNSLILPFLGLNIGKQKLSILNSPQLNTLQNKPIDVSQPLPQYSSPPMIFRKPNSTSTNTPSQGSNTPSQWSSVEDLLNGNVESNKQNSEFSPFSTSSSESPQTFARHVAAPRGFGDGGEVTASDTSTDIQPVTETINNTYSSSEKNTQDDTAELEALASEIYHRLRQRIEIERERYGGNSGKFPW